MVDRPALSVKCGIVAIFAYCACSAPQQPPSETRPGSALSAIPTASGIVANSAEPMPSAAPTTTASTEPTTMREYPKEWIDDAMQENRSLSCFELIYKRGCSEIRRGKVTFDITLAEDGSVVSVKEIDNRISREPEVVSRCLEKSLPRWRFHPPDGTMRTFSITLLFADKC